MMRARGRWWLAALAVLPAACSSPSSAEPADVIGHVRLSNFEISAPRTLTHGRIRFEIVGGGPSMHELVLSRTDLAGGDLPRNADGTVSEDDPRNHHIDEAEGVDAGDHRDLYVTLRPGHYV